MDNEWNIVLIIATFFETQIWWCEKETRISIWEIIIITQNGIMNIWYDIYMDIKIDLLKTLEEMCIFYNYCQLTQL